MIILVDDNADQRLVLRLALAQAGYSVRDAANGREGLALQRARPSKVLITDIFMPEADGFELLDSLKRGIPRDESHRRVRGRDAHNARLLGFSQADGRRCDA